jgi:ABC-type Mn2+/Zn2+ transport system ATPase subunit
MSEYSIAIENCNSIEKAEIKISKGALNIKYGPNGLGKSTIARAIVASVLNNGSLQNLKPFKYRSVVGQHEPVVRGAENI